MASSRSADYSGDSCRLKASALIVTINYGYDPGTIDIMLKNGAWDRVYGNGTNPDPEGRGLPDIPHKRRRDDFTDAVEELFDNRPKK